MEGVVQAHVIISGKVQGVFFRRHVQKHAEEIGVKGYVKNLESGDVEVIAQGTKNLVKELIAYCKEGPILSQIDNVEVSFEVPGKIYNEFTVIR